MPKWQVEVSGTIEVEANSEDDAIEAAIDKVEADAENSLFFDAETDALQCQSCAEWITPEDADHGVTINAEEVCSVCEQAGNHDEEDEEDEEDDDDEEDGDEEDGEE